MSKRGSRFWTAFSTLSGLILVIALVWPAQAEADEPTEAEVIFALRVQPILEQKCLACHGADEDNLRGGLWLNSRDDMLFGGNTSEEVLVPGNAQASLLYQVVLWDHPEKRYRMPPKENDRLTEEQAWAIRDWINAGAPWPDPKTIDQIVAQQAQGVQVATSGGLAESWDQRRYEEQDLWAYRPVKRPEVPEIDGAAHPVDAFLQAKMIELGVEPAPLADRRTLIRRVSFNLTGLPPTPEQIERFLADPAPEDEALAKLVDRLLASPHYGEQWGRHWLDVARYADTAGLANDYERPNAWRYRDYVVRAFNDDKPYDQFVREQIAGDEIDSSDPEMLIAVGFLRMGPWEQTSMTVPKVARQQFLDDVTDAVGQTFLAHPLQCAKCHDHKFDPIPTRDYYAIQAVFATTQFAERDAEFLESENIRDGFEEREYLDDRLSYFAKRNSEISRKSREAERAWYAERGLEYATRGEKIKQGVPEDQIAPRFVGLDTADAGLQRICNKNRTRHRWEKERYEPIAYSVYSGKTREWRDVSSRLMMPESQDNRGRLERTRILTGGDVFSPGDPVTPGVFSALLSFTQSIQGTASPAWQRPMPETIAGRRLAFANWLTAPENPLTARVMVNRIWQHHFGRGIVNTPNNFGKMGGKPTHPELLDWLTSEFLDSGWSIKAMHRLILSSQAYRRISGHPEPDSLAARDPTGISAASFRTRRLSAEEIRDAMLLASGELNRTLGGVPARPDINPEAALQPRQIMGTVAPAYQASPTPGQRNRRSIYAMRIRGLRDPMLTVFNQPGFDESCAMRDASTVTPQAFSLFNGQETADRALALADRLIRETNSPEEAIGQAFLRTTGAEPSPADLRDFLAHWDRMTDVQQAIRYQPRIPPAEVRREAVEELTGASFIYVEPLETNADYVPDLQPHQVDARTRALGDLCLVLFNSNPFLYVD